MRIHGNLTKAKRANRTRDGPVFLLSEISQ